jgi:sialic acid synthase SpsE
MFNDRSRTVILDLGSGNTCNNDRECIKEMIDSIPQTSKFDVVLKWQLFKEAGPNVPLTQNSFDFAYNYAKVLGFKTTASVFDLGSLQYLLRYDIPFVKLANSSRFEYLIKEVPFQIPVYLSWDGMRDFTYLFFDEILACVSEYPAKIETYVGLFDEKDLHDAISDHTVGLELFKKYKPYIWEKHYKLKDSTGLDAGPFAVTPNELKEIF